MVHGWSRRRSAARAAAGLRWPAWRRCPATYAARGAPNIHRVQSQFDCREARAFSRFKLPAVERRALMIRVPRIIRRGGGAEEPTSAKSRSPPSTGGQQDRGRSAGPGFPDLDGSGGTGGGPPPDHAGPQADVAGLPDPDAGPRPDAAGRGAGRRTTSPDPGRIPAGTAGPGRVLGQGRAAPRTAKTPITRGPPVVAVAVSLDPILPQR